ncbi:hypothetical protein [Nostoc sp. CALU 1950]|uniref:hypothetical protein n=1 Tax=Nostoc sp. CALU 1950 TaxID=3104321 RepID=UPI003EC0E160
MSTTYLQPALTEVQSQEFAEGMKAVVRFTFKLARVIALLLLTLFSLIKQTVDSRRQVAKVSQLTEVDLVEVVSLITHLKDKESYIQSATTFQPSKLK